MTTFRMFAGGGVMLGALLLLAPAIPAQQGNPGPGSQATKPARTKGMQAGNVERRLKHLSTRLELTDDQKKQILPILQEEASKVDQLRADEKVSRVQRRAKLQDIRDEMFAKINTILTPEQKKKHEELRKQAQERRQK